MDLDWTWLWAVYGWLYHWQTLVGALTALVAAIATIAVMRHQMNVEAERHRDAQKRKRMAARAQMPDALSNMSAYVRDCAARLMGTAEGMPDEPTEAISTLKEVIEFIDDGAAARTFELVSWYQVFRARMSHDVPSPERHEFSDLQYDAVLLQAYVNSLYGYARNEEKEVEVSEPSLEEMDDSFKSTFRLRQIMLREELYDSVRAHIQRRHKPRSGK